MAEPTSRIEPTHSYPEPDAQKPRGQMKVKVHRKPAPADSSEQGPADAEEQEKHELDTLA